MLLMQPPQSIVKVVDWKGNDFEASKESKNIMGNVVDAALQTKKVDR